MPARNLGPRRSGLSLATAVLLWCAAAAPAMAQGAFPARLDAYFTKVLKLTAAERKLLLSGAPLAKNLEADPGKEVAVFGAIWIKAQLERVVRAMAVDYVTAYRAGGNSRLAVYRDSANPTFVANEFRELVSGMPELGEFLPSMRQYLLDYPKPAARPTSSFIYWQEAEFGLKPTIRISHVAIQEDKDATIVASKQLYSSHYFWTALELRALVPDPSRGPGFWFVNVNRSRSDGLTGFVGRIIRGKVREGARKGMQSALTGAKKTLEAR